MFDFPSGEWVGFYNYSNRQRRFMMDLILSFRGGRITGEGADGIGGFIVDGTYSETDGECRWLKTYVARHSVPYCGFRENKGIWGTWTLNITRGGFHIWPLGQGLDFLVTEEEEKILTSVPYPIVRSDAVPGRRAPLVSGCMPLF